MTQKIIYWLLCLEIYLRRTNIKPAPWREKIKKYFPEYQCQDRVPNLIINHNHRAAYLCIFKSGSTTLTTTLVESEKRHDELILLQRQIVKKTGKWINLSGFIRHEENSKFFQTNMKFVYFNHKNNQFMCLGRDVDGFHKLPITPKEINDKFVFTFVRNPFIRVVSVFQDKYKKQPDGKYVSPDSYRGKNWLKNWSYKIKNFEMLAQSIYLMPDLYLNPHLIPQHYSIQNTKKRGVKIDFLGRLENFDEDFQKIPKDLDLLPSKHFNASKKEKADWRDYYSPKTAKLIYKRYRKDFEQFGYEDEYPKLLEYLKTKR